MKYFKRFLFLLTLLLLQACANYKLHYAKEDDFVKSAAIAPTGKLTHTMFLIGDAGNAAPGAIPPAVQLLEVQLKSVANPKDASVIYLGDNLYPNGFAPRRAVAERKLDEHRLKVQLDAVKDFKGRIFFVAGNHDWYTYGIEGLKREKKFIEDYLGREDVWLPKPGCGDPMEVELNDDLTLILLDTEWWLADWNGHTEINDGCDVKSRKAFAQLFEEAIKSNRNKNIVVAMHHPLYTYGSHGGQFTAKDHFFPLTAVRKKLQVPLPGLGSVYPFMRSVIGSPQDIAYSEYKLLRRTLTDAARKNGSFIFAAGHEHTLQYIEQDEQSFIVSGSGSKLSPVRLGAGSEFAYGYYGFATLEFYDNGAVWMKFWTPEGDDAKGKLVFQKQIKAALPKAAPLTRDSFVEYFSKKDSVTKPLSSYDFEKSKTWRLLWGEHYRKTYATPMKFPVLDLAKQDGGLKATKLGGGQQTNSLRLEDKKEREYAIRSIEKDASRTAPYPFNESFLTDLIKDNFSGAHPLAALPAAKLADAAGIFHTDPTIYYVPKQPALEDYNELFGNGLYQFEKRPQGDWSDADYFANAQEFESTIDVINKITDDPDNRIDYPQVVRSRLFDILIGDWDRHDDQWRWAESEAKDGKKIYTPIPRDRDQAFSKYDGFLFAYLRNYTPSTRNFKPYRETIKDIRWASYNARAFDPTFLTTLEWKDWQREVQHLQTQLTDSIIENAFRQTFPAVIFERDGQEIMRILKARRDDLPSLARRHYEFVNRKVDVLGTEKRELFEVNRLNADSTRVTVFVLNKEGEQKEKRYDRTFLTTQTREVRLYGLDGDDVFNVTGEVEASTLIRIIGGLGDDVFNDKSSVRTGTKRTIVYDAIEEKNQVNGGPETKERLSTDPVMNTYNRKAPDYEFDYGFRSTILNLNPDDGILLGISAHHTTYGYKKSPYSTRHALSLRYALETSAFSTRYNGEYINVLGKWDLLLNAQYNTPLYAINFYGFGNETPDHEQNFSEKDEDAAADYVRVRQRLFRLEPALLKRVNSGFSWSVGPTFESIRIDKTPNRLVEELSDDLNPKLFTGLEFLGAHVQTNVQILDNSAFPTRGVGFSFDTGWKMQLNDTERNFPYLRSALSIYQRLISSGNLVFATRVGVWHNFNTKFEFYQGATLGGGLTDYANFRGARRERFTGQTAFYHNTDLRWKLLNSRNRALPFTLGITGGFDYGRVWLNSEENSKALHYAYGGGVFFSPLNLLTLQASLFRGDDNRSFFTLGGGFFF